MTERFLTITLQPSRQAGWHTAAQARRQSMYQGEALNVESPGHFFGQLSKKRGVLVSAAHGKGNMPLRERAQLMGRDGRPAHENLVVLADLGLLEHAEPRGVFLPYVSMHTDRVLKAA